MFENLSKRLSGVLDQLTKQGSLSDSDINAALREVRVALLEADVSLSVTRSLIKSVEEKAQGQAGAKQEQRHLRFGGRILVGVRE